MNTREYKDIKLLENHKEGYINMVSNKGHWGTTIVEINGIEYARSLLLWWSTIGVTVHGVDISDSHSEELTDAIKQYMYIHLLYDQNIHFKLFEDIKLYKVCLLNNYNLPCMVCQSLGGIIIFKNERFEKTHSRTKPYSCLSAVIRMIEKQFGNKIEYIYINRINR